MKEYQTKLVGIIATNDLSILYENVEYLKTIILLPLKHQLHIDQRNVHPRVILGVILKQLGYLLTLWLRLINTGKWLAKQQMQH